jgi:acyl carrier protein
MLDRIEVKNFIVDFLVKKEGEFIRENIDRCDLIDAGILDSLDIIDLALKLQERYSIRFDFSLPETFDAMRTVDSMVLLVTS